MERMVTAWAGVAAAIAGLGAGHLVAGWVNPAASPLVAVGSVVVDLTPTPMKEWAADTFGTADKAVLLVVVTVVVLALAAGAGWVAARRLTWALLMAGGLGLIAIAAALSRPGAGRLDWLPGLVTAGVGAAALVLLVRRSPAARPGGSAGPGESTDRRRFLVAASGLAVGGGLLAAIGQRAAAPTPNRAPLPLPLPTAAAPLPDLAPGLDATVPGISPWRTPVPDFYRIDIALTVPRIDPGTWRLTVDGLVERPFSLDLAELLSMPLIERDITLTCVSNPIGGPYVGSTRWLGVRVADLLRRAGPRPGADMVLSSAADGFTASTPLSVLLDGRDAMIAVAMDGEPLTDVHGAPARLLTPGLYGYVGATKWLDRLQVTTFAQDVAYWTQRGWAPQGPVKTACRIDTPGDRAGAGRVIIAGVAWATHRGIESVEVQVDDGPWREAVLGPSAGVDYWRQWFLPWDAAAGTHTLRARATDLRGERQTDQVTGVFPDGPTGYAVRSVRIG